MEIAREMKIHVLHWHDLRVTAAGCSALHPEARTERRFPNADCRLLPDGIQSIAEADGGCRLAFACRRRIDGRYQYQVAVIPFANRLDELVAQFRLVVPEWKQMLARNSQLCAHLLDRQLFRFPGDFNIRSHSIAP